jgi:gentisate 1,2-dioxygenase
MSTNLGTMEDLPADYRQAVQNANTTPLWPLMRKALPHDTPVPQSKACLWAYEDIRPLLLRAGELTPVEKAERRVLILSDPGRGPGAMRVAGPIFCGMQLLLPGEKAPAHRHTPSAARVVIEGEGAYTIVNGEKCMMEPGDVILTPGGAWHDHGHDGKGPVIWLDALDLPLFIDLEAAYSVERELQAPKNRPDASEVEYATPGMVPARRNGQARPSYPMMRYPWANAVKGLRALAEQTPRGEPVELDYINPETGDACLPTMGFTAMMLRPGETVAPPLRSTSAVHHVVEGSGQSTVNGETFRWKRGDTFSAPVFALIEHSVGKEPAFLIRVHDTPLQQKLNYYEERPRPQQAAE